MTRPTVSDFTEDLYARLPEIYRLGDAAQADGPLGYPLLRYIGSAIDSIDSALVLLDRITFTPSAPGDHDLAGDGLAGDGYAGDFEGDTSDLVNPSTADDAWLLWLAQLIGVDVSGLNSGQIRDVIQHAANNFGYVGTRQSMIDVVKPYLTGTKTVVIDPTHDPMDPTTEPNPAHAVPFLIGVGTLHAETHLRSWDDFEATCPTWDDVDASLSWDEVDGNSFMTAVRAVTPAGYQAVHYWLD